jgi:hypothetical protein
MRVKQIKVVIQLLLDKTQVNFFNHLQEELMVLGLLLLVILQGKLINNKMRLLLVIKQVEVLKEQMGLLLV